MTPLREALERLTTAQANLVTVRLEWRDARRDLRRERAARLLSGHYSGDREERDAHLRVALADEYDALHAAGEAVLLAKAEAERADAEWRTLLAEAGQNVKEAA